MLELIKLTFSKLFDFHCSRRSGLVKNMMGTVWLTPNNNQYTIATHATYQVILSKKTRLL